MNAPLALRLADAIEEPNRPNKKRAIQRAAAELRRLHGAVELLTIERDQLLASLADAQRCAASGANNAEDR